MVNELYRENKYFHILYKQVHESLAIHWTTNYLQSANVYVKTILKRSKGSP